MAWRLAMSLCRTVPDACQQPGVSAQASPGLHTWLHISLFQGCLKGLGFISYILETNSAAFFLKIYVLFWFISDPE